MRNFANYHVDVRRHTSGVVKTICEQCLPTRHNKRDRSLRVNIDTGHCHCYHCGADFYVPDDAEEREKAERQAARKRRVASAVPQHFRRPVFDASKTTLSEATERWLVETRCIPQSVIAGLRITEQEEFMSQSGAKERCVCFNYFEEGKLVNTKFRSGAKNFKMVQGAELIPYNIDSVLGQDTCIIHEGELDAASSLAAGFKSVISVPAGANANLSWLDRFMESHFENLKDIIIAVDTDSAGLKLRDELVNRLGAERCRVAVYGPGCKDANEHLVKYGIDSLRIAIEQAEEILLKASSPLPICTKTCGHCSTTASVPVRRRAGRRWIRFVRTNVGGWSSLRAYRGPENRNGWTNWCCASVCAISGRSRFSVRRIILSSTISAS